MIAYGSVIGSQEKFERCAAPGLARVMEPDSVLAEYTDAASICDAYNEVLDAVRDRDDLEALVLLHDDTEILSSAFCDAVRERLRDPEVAIVGAVGARDVKGLRWWEGDCRGHVAETRGTVDFGGGAHEVDVLDGLVLVLSPWAVRTLRFDAETFGRFHGYDADICMQARAAGRKVVVDQLPVFHHTKGGYGDEDAFRAADRAFRRKWLDGEAAEAAPAAAPAQRDAPAAAGVRDGVEGPLGVYYEGDRPDLAALVPLEARRVLDVGCGTGSLAAGIKARQGAEVAGIELFPEAAEIARTRLDHFVRADLDTLSELPFDEGFFDVAIFGDVLEHLRGPDRLLRTIRRYLAPDGRIICSLPNVKHWSVVLPLLVQDAWTYADAGLLDRTHVHFFTLAEAQRMLAECGFEIESVGTHDIALPAGTEAIVEVAGALGADRPDAKARLEAYQYLLVARPA